MLAINWKIVKFILSAFRCIFHNWANFRYQLVYAHVFYTYFNLKLICLEFDISLSISIPQITFFQANSTIVWKSIFDSLLSEYCYICYKFMWKSFSKNCFSYRLIQSFIIKLEFIFQWLKIPVKMLFIWYVWYIKTSYIIKPYT